MASRTCPACGRPRGTSAECLSCRREAARELAEEARDVTPAAVPGRADRVGGFLARPPWWARAAPRGLLDRLRLLWMVLRDYADGSYRKIPWKAVVTVAAAAAYVLSPVDLIPDFLVPLGWSDDLLLLAMTWGMVKQALRDYCSWKGLAPAHFGL